MYKILIFLHDLSSRLLLCINFLAQFFISLLLQLFFNYEVQSVVHHRCISQVSIINLKSKLGPNFRTSKKMKRLSLHLPSMKFLSKNFFFISINWYLWILLLHLILVFLSQPVIPLIFTNPKLSQQWRKFLMSKLLDWFW